MGTVAAGQARRIPAPPLSTDVRRHLAVLGLPTFGLALSITVVSAYLPTVAKDFDASDAVIGLIIGAEGAGAVLLPVALGAWSDRLRTRWGRRLPFVAAGAPLAIAGLVWLSLAGSLAGLAVAVGVFFTGYFIAYEPYRALYADLVPDESAGQGQSVQAACRGIGTGVALLAGGLLLAVSQALPFAVAAAVLAVTIGLFLRFADPDAEPPEDPEGGRAGVGERMRTVWELARRTPALRAFFLANALWELSLAALKTFVVLWVTRELGLSLSSAALVIGAVALLVLAGAVLSGRLADRHGRTEVMTAAVVAFGAPMAVLVVTTDKLPILAAAVPIAVGGGMLMALPYALLQPLMPAGQHGALTGFYSVSRGVGIVLGPVIAGVTVSLAGDLVAGTEGYAATWAVCGIAALASLPLLRRVERTADDPVVGGSAA